MCVRLAKVQARVAAHTNHLFRVKEQECVSQNDAACKNDRQMPCPLREQAESVSTRPTESREDGPLMPNTLSTEGFSLQTAGQQTRPPPVPFSAPLKLESSEYHVISEWQMLAKCQRAQESSQDQAVLTCDALTTHFKQDAVDKLTCCESSIYMYKIDFCNLPFRYTAIRLLGCSGLLLGGFSLDTFFIINQ